MVGNQVREYSGFTTSKTRLLEFISTICAIQYVQLFPPHSCAEYVAFSKEINTSLLLQNISIQCVRCMVVSTCTLMIHPL